MKFVQSILLRYYFLFKKDFIINLLLFFLFPIISFIFIVLPFSKIIKVSFLEINIDYISWVCIPFLYFTSSLFSMMIASESTNEYIYRNFLVESIKTTSIKLIYLLISILVFSLFCGVIEFIISYLILYSLVSIAHAFLNILYYVLLLIVYLFLFSNIGVLIGFIRIKYLRYLIYSFIMLANIFYSNIFIPYSKSTSLMQFKKIQYLLIDFYNNIRVLMFSDYNFQYNSIFLLAIIGFVIFIINHQIVLYLYQKK